MGWGFGSRVGSIFEGHVGSDVVFIRGSVFIQYYSTQCCRVLFTFYLVGVVLESVVDVVPKSRARVISEGGGSLRNRVVRAQCGCTTIWDE